MSDTTGTQIAVTPARRPLRAGANALGIVPQTIEDVWKIAKYVCLGKMAPDGLIKNRNPDEQASAVSTIILSGLELGLSPMVSLRSFGMINGKPGLYGDGLINVCRRHSTAEYVKLGFIPGSAEEFGDDAKGWCEAKRSDTGEVSREEFSIGDAKRAGLWEDKALIRKQIWENGNKVWKDNVPNDATWFRYPKRMLQWRAAGYCLRNLFADVLGGVPTMDELQEVFGDEDMRDVTATAQITRSAPPAPPEEFDADKFAAMIIEGVGAAPDEESLIKFWEDNGVDNALADHDDLLNDVYAARDKRLAAFADEPEPDEPAANETEDEPGLDFPGDKP